MSIQLGQVLLTAVVTAVVGLLVMESYQTTPWLADKLMRWSVRLRYTDNPERATIRGEELISLLEDLPTLFKLPTAGGFFLCALASRLANRRSYGSHFKLAVKRDVLLLPAFFLFNCFIFSAWTQLDQAATKPWLALVWLYGLIMLIPLAWRDRVPVTVFAIQCVLAVAAWPIMHLYIPIVGILVALYAVSVHRSRKISLLALLASFIPNGLAVAAIFKVNSDPGELILFIAQAVLLVAMVSGAWGAGRVTQAGQQNVQRQTEPRAGQLSLEARFHVKRDVLLLPAFFLCNCFIFSAWIQLDQVATKPWLALVWLYGLIMLIPLAWRDRVPVTVFAIQCVLAVAAWPIMHLYIPIVGIPVALYAVSVHRSRKISLLALLASFIPNGLVGAAIFKVNSAPGELILVVANAVLLVVMVGGAWGLGRVTRASQRHVQHQTRMIGSAPIPVVLPISLSGPGVINPEPSISIGEPHGEGELS